MCLKNVTIWTSSFMLSRPIIAATSTWIVGHDVGDLLPNEAICSSFTVPMSSSRFARSSDMNDNCEPLSNNARVLSQIFGLFGLLTPYT